MNRIAGAAIAGYVATGRVNVAGLGQQTDGGQVADRLPAERVRARRAVVLRRRARARRRLVKAGLT